MLDTSALVAALVRNHQLHREARPLLPPPAAARLPGIVLAETYARLRGEPFRVSAGDCATLLGPWSREGDILVTSAAAYRRAFDDAPALHLGGQIHDYLIALTCAEHGCALVTADRRQAELARPVLEPEGLEVTLLTPAD